MRTLKTVVVITLAIGASIAIADKLSDFKEAARKRGYDSIPYSDLRSDCKSEGSHVHEYCDGSKGPITCGSPNTTRDLKDAVEREKKAVEELEAAIEVTTAPQLERAMVRDRFTAGDTSIVCHRRSQRKHRALLASRRARRFRHPVSGLA